MKETYIQIGQAALRAPDGSFLPAVPLYTKVPEKDVDKKTGVYKGENATIRDISKTFAENMRKYIERSGMQKALERSTS